MGGSGVECQAHDWDSRAVISRRPQDRAGAGRRGQDALAALVQGITDYAIFMLDRHGHVTSWNPGAERINGYAAQEVVGRHLSIFYTEEDRVADKPTHNLEVAAANGVFEEEGWRVRKDGSRFWAFASITPLWSENGQLRGFAKITRDDTHRKQAAEERVRLQLIEAREQLGRELHHEVVQRLFSIGLQLEGALTLAERPDVKSRLGAAVDEVDGLIRQIRTTLWEAARDQPEPEANDDPGLNILVVDDDDDMQVLLSEFLKHLGRVDVVPDAYEAISWLDSNEPDVMVLDLILPGATGVDLLDRLREHGRHIPTVIVSGTAPEDELTSLARDAGAITVVAKPFDRRQLSFTALEAARSNG